MDLSLWVVELAGARGFEPLYLFETETDARLFTASKSVNHVLKKNPETVIMVWNLYGDPMPIEEARS